jgi:hypothetical protein
MLKDLLDVDSPDSFESEQTNDSRRAGVGSLFYVTNIVWHPAVIPKRMWADHSVATVNTTKQSTGSDIDIGQKILTLYYLYAVDITA